MLVYINYLHIFAMSIRHKTKFYIMEITSTQIKNLITLTNNELKKLEASRNTSTLSDVALNEKIEELNALFSLLSLEYFDKIASNLNASTERHLYYLKKLQEVKENKL